MISKTVKQMSVEKYMAEWLIDHKKLGLKSKSYNTLECSLRYQVFPYFKGWQFFSLTHDEIQKFINILNKAGCSYSLIRKAYLTSNTCLKEAMTKNDLEKNLCMLIRLPKKGRAKSAVAVFYARKPRACFICTEKAERYNFIENGKVKPKLPFYNPQNETYYSLAFIGFSENEPESEGNRNCADNSVRKYRYPAKTG